MVYAVDQERKTKDIGKEDELLYFVSFYLAVYFHGDIANHTCRTSVHIWPTEVKNWIAVIHSLWLSLVSRA